MKVGSKLYSRNVSTTPLWQCGFRQCFRQCLPFSWSCRYIWAYTAASKQPWLWTYLYYILSELKNTARPAPPKNKSSNFWHVTSILVCCIFDNKNPIVYLQKSWKLDTLYVICVYCVQTRIDLLLDINVTRFHA